MNSEMYNSLSQICSLYYERAEKFIQSTRIQEKQFGLSDEVEIPGFEKKTPELGQFVEKEFVAMTVDIRDSTAIINQVGGIATMFKISYLYSAMIAKIVDEYGGTSTEFLGDGVLNLFEADDRDKSLRDSLTAAQDVLESMQKILNPFLRNKNIQPISAGIGIDVGTTIVTRFGLRDGNDLKAFGRCVYNSAKLSKGINEILIAEDAKKVWPSSHSGRLIFNNPPKVINGINAYSFSYL